MGNPRGRPRGRPRCKPAVYNVYTNYESIPMLMTVEQACNLLQMTDQTIYNYIRKGIIEACKIGDQWRIPKDKLLNLEVKT